MLKRIDTTAYGARPLRRTLEQFVENKIASLLIESLDKTKKRVLVSHKDNSIEVSMT